MDLEPTRGAEMQKTRPAVVLSSDRLGRLPLRLIVPLTGWNDNYRGYFWMARVEATRVNGLTKPSADAFQTRGASLERFEERLAFSRRKPLHAFPEL